jgi:hypothetical protein
MQLQFGDTLARVDNSNVTGSAHRVEGLYARESFGICSLVGGAEGSGKWSDGFIISGCSADVVYGNAIIVSESLKNGIIENNTIDSVGLVQSAGAIYMPSCYAPVGEEIHIRGNSVNDQKFGRNWLHDGRTVMMDSNSQNVWVYRNLATNSHNAFGSNSGRAGNRLFSNISVGCDSGYVESDTAVVGQATTIIANNLFLDCGINKYFTDVAQNDDNSAVNIATKQVGATCRHYIYNNVITGVGTAAEAQGIGMEPSGAAAGVVVDSHNIIAGFARAKGNWGTTMATGPGTSTVMPTVGYFNGVPSGTSNSLGAGVAVNKELTDYAGRIFRSPPSIGAFEQLSPRRWL